MAFSLHSKSHSNPCLADNIVFAIGISISNTNTRTHAHNTIDKSCRNFTYTQIEQQQHQILLYFHLTSLIRPRCLSCPHTQLFTLNPFSRVCIRIRSPKVMMNPFFFFFLQFFATTQTYIALRKMSSYWFWMGYLSWLFDENKTAVLEEIKEWHTHRCGCISFTRCCVRVLDKWQSSE